MKKSSSTHLIMKLFLDILGNFHKNRVVMLFLQIFLQVQTYLTQVFLMSNIPVVNGGNVINEDKVSKTWIGDSKLNSKQLGNYNSRLNNTAIMSYSCRIYKFISSLEQVERTKKIALTIHVPSMISQTVFVSFSIATHQVSLRG